MRTFPLLALSLLAIAPLSSAAWGSLSFVGGDQACLVPTTIYVSCLHWGLSGSLHADSCDATNVCHFSYNVQAGVSSQDPTPRIVTLTRDNVTACEAEGIEQWVHCDSIASFDVTLAPGQCGNTEFHVTAAYGTSARREHIGSYGHSPYRRPDYATIDFCRNATTGEVDSVWLVRDYTLYP